MRYLLGIGSNVDPEINVPRILEALLETADRLDASRVVRTPPIGPIEGGDFLNLVVALESSHSLAELQPFWQSIETRLGRDREHPDRKRRSREADIDHLLTLADGVRRLDAADLPDEPFVRPALLELLQHLGIRHQAGRLPLPEGVPLRVAGRWIGERPTSLTAPG